jgi:hypothetical protein
MGQTVCSATTFWNYQLTSRYATPKEPVDPYATPPVMGAPDLPPPPSAPGGPRANARTRVYRSEVPQQTIPSQPLVPPNRKRQTNTRTTTSHGNGSSSNGASTSHSNDPIDLASESEDEDVVEVDQSIEILGENPASRNQAGGSNGHRAASRQPPPRKRARPTGEDSDDIIFIDD